MFLPSWVCPVVRRCLSAFLSYEKDFNKLVRFLVLVEFEDKIITEDNMVFTVLCLNCEVSIVN